MAQTKTKQSRTVKYGPNDLPSFLALLANTRPEDWKMSRRQFYRWRAGLFNEGIDLLIKNPTLLKALARDVAAREREAREAGTE